MTHGGHPRDDGHVLYVIGTFPLLTTTFIDRELAALSERGVDIRLVSIRTPVSHLSPRQMEIMSEVRYVMPVSYPRLLLALVRALITHPVALLGTLIRLVSGDHPSLWERFRTVGHVVLGVYVWSLVRRDPPRHVHAHFVDRAATVAIVVAALLGTGYSATAHANDIYVNPVLLTEKANLARFVATCTEFNKRHLAEVVPGGRVELVYHGLDLGRYEASPVVQDDVGHIISVAQLKEKKGLTHLISACRELVEAGVSFECDIVGDGPLEGQLREQIHAEELEETVHLLGSLPHDQVIERLRVADLFVLPSVIAEDGDRDGIPNVILEAMAMGRPVVSTTVSGIAEAVVDGVTGRLVSPGDAFGLARVVADLLSSPETRSDMGAAGRRRIEERFDVSENARSLEQLLMA